MPVTNGVTSHSTHVFDAIAPLSSRAALVRDHLVGLQQPDGAVGAAVEVDHRLAERARVVGHLEPAAADEEALDVGRRRGIRSAPLPAAGGWIHELGPLEWSSDPGASLDSQAFWKTFHDCSNKLPKNVATVFTLREVDGIESKEICQLLNISENNLWVMLHRARMALRRCLETNWFGKQP